MIFGKCDNNFCEFYYIETYKKDKMYSTQEDDDFVFLSFGQTPYHQQSCIRVPPAQFLFKEMQYQTQAKKELKMKNKELNIYQKIKKELQKKLGQGRLMKGMSTKDQIKIRQMIQTCDQRKHLRTSQSLNFSSSPTNQKGKEKQRNFSAKQSYKGRLSTSRATSSKPQIPRPLTSRPMKTRPIASRLQTIQNANDFQKLNIKGLRFSNQGQTHSQIILKKKGQRRQYIRKTENKQNNLLFQTASTNFCFEEIPNHQSTYGKKGKLVRRKQNKQILRSHINKIIQNCDNEKQDIIGIDRKIGYFDYFCQKMNLRKSNIQKFCTKMDIVKHTFDD